LDIIERFSKEKNATHAQIAIAWILAKKPWIVPIPGTTKIHRLTENNDAISIEFSKEELQEIETASAQINIVGTRYTEAMENATGL
jgi:aryl-alcohol dehydrogenase-like predicted oxidoreductase